ncbi:hypothetical protein OLS73_08065, partial [Campylobacter jejuni]|nr:hypothetical protein [Campylobacter jejuni]
MKDLEDVLSADTLFMSIELIKVDNWAKYYIKETQKDFLMKRFELKGLENFLKKCENLENEQKQIILKEIIAETLYKESKENLEKNKTL